MKKTEKPEPVVVEPEEARPEPPPKVDSKFRYVLVAAQRAEQLMRGARPKVDVKGKPTRIAMAEVDHEQVQWGYGPAPVETAEVSEGEEGVEAGAEVH